MKLFPHQIQSWARRLPAEQSEPGVGRLGDQEIVPRNFTGSLKPHELPLTKPKHDDGIDDGGDQPGRQHRESRSLKPRVREEDAGEAGANDKDGSLNGNVENETADSRSRDKSPE